MELISISRDKYGYPTTSPKFDELNKAFRAVLPNSNFITPELVGYIEIPNGIIEITKSDRVNTFLLNGKEVYGITILIGNKVSDLSKGGDLNSLSECMNYINGLNLTNS